MKNIDEILSSRPIRICVTGGAGFIGSHLVHTLLTKKIFFRHGLKIVIVDNLSTGRKENIPKSNDVRFIKCDVNNYREISEVMIANQFDYVFHYAAVVGVKRTQERPMDVLRDIEGIKNILSLCKSTEVIKIFFSSSSEVYGESIEFPQKEMTTPLNSRLPYAVVKNVCESYIQSYQKEYGLDYTIFRFFNTYGPRQSEDFVMNKFIQAALKGNDITIYGDGSQKRTFCWIDDNVEACLEAFMRNKFVNDVVNIGSDIEISILELAKAIVYMSNSSSKIVHVPALKEGDMSRRMPDNSKMMELMPGRELCPLRDGINVILKNSITL